MRLITRSDFDGLGCAALLMELGMIDDFKFVHPKDIQDGKVAVNENDILANIPYVAGCGLWFDHHSSEEERLGAGTFKGKSDANALSAARVVYDYYGGDEKFRNEHLKTLIKAVDKADSAQFTGEEILDPEGWVLVSFIMDPRTGLGRYRDYRISNYALMENLANLCRSKSAEEILELPDVKERVVRYREQNEKFIKMIQDTSRVHGNLAVTDLRETDEIFTGNRFVVYSLFPEQNISIQVMWGFKRQNIVFTCGHSIINRSSNTNVGSLMLKYGGGGHHKVGTCQVPTEDADRSLQEIIEAINADG